MSLFLGRSGWPKRAQEPGLALARSAPRSQLTSHATWFWTGLDRPGEEKREQAMDQGEPGPGYAEPR